MKHLEELGLPVLVVASQKWLPPSSSTKLSGGCPCSLSLSSVLSKVNAHPAREGSPETCYTGKSERSLAPMRVFISYSHADKNIAAKLRRSLEERGLSFKDPGANGGDSWRQQLEGAIRSADVILLLLSPRQRIDEQQQLTWRLALEAVWADPAKRLIPILLQDAELPAFVRSGASGDSIQAVRVREPKDLALAAQAILRTLSANPPEEGGNGSVRKRVVYSPPVSYSHRRRVSVPVMVESYPAVTEEDRVQRRERLSAIKQYAEQLKS
jgi:hypothetical protein